MMACPTGHSVSACDTGSPPAPVPGHDGTGTHHSNILHVAEPRCGSEQVRTSCGSLVGLSASHLSWKQNVNITCVI